MPDVTVVIPVGPSEANKRWLKEAVESCLDQKYLGEILFIDDKANIRQDLLYDWTGDWELWNVWETPWQSGVAHAFNFGVGLAKNELVFMLGSDDYLAPDCLNQCIRAWEENQRQDAYYWVGVEYLDDRETKKQFVPCNAAMVTKGFWKWCGGFPPETASGAPDAALISMLWGSKKLICVNEHKPLYYYRSHNESDTAGRGPWQGVILQTRDILTAQFKQRK